MLFRGHNEESLRGLKIQLNVTSRVYLFIKEVVNEFHIVPSFQRSKLTIVFTDSSLNSVQYRAVAGEERKM